MPLKYIVPLSGAEVEEKLWTNCYETIATAAKSNGVAREPMTSNVLPTLLFLHLLSKSIIALRRCRDKKSSSGRRQGQAGVQSDGTIDEVFLLYDILLPPLRILTSLLHSARLVFSGPSLAAGSSRCCKGPSRIRAALLCSLLSWRWPTHLTLAASPPTADQDFLLPDLVSFDCTKC